VKDTINHVIYLDVLIIYYVISLSLLSTSSIITEEPDKDNNTATININIYLD